MMVHVMICRTESSGPTEVDFFYYSSFPPHTRSLEVDVQRSECQLPQSYAEVQQLAHESQLAREVDRQRGEDAAEEFVWEGRERLAVPRPPLAAAVRSVRRLGR